MNDSIITSVTKDYLEPLKYNYLFFQSILLLSLLCKTQKSWLSNFLVPEILNNTFEFPSGFKYSLNYEAIKNTIEIENQDEQLSILGDQAQIICMLHASALLFEGMKIEELNKRIKENFTKIDPINGNKLYGKFKLICEFFRHIFVHAKDWKIEEKSLERFKKDHKIFLEENQYIIKFIAKGENLYLNIDLDFNNISPRDNIFNFIKSEQIIYFLEFSHQITDHLQNSINKIENEATETAKGIP